MMQVTLHRCDFGPEHIIGRLRITHDDTGRSLDLWTMERPWRNNRYNESCIPTGDYECRMGKSPRFGDCYYLDPRRVSPRTHILFHAGNCASDTRGCILPGLERGSIDGKPAVLNSRLALRKLEKQCMGEPFILRIVIGYPEGTGYGVH